MAVLNLMGRVFMTPLDDPFALALREVETLRAKARVIFVDFHAEATSEKIAMGWHLDGRVTAVVGTHTHVQTADERMLPKGTACLTDAGMTGPHDSIIGVTVDAALGRFVNGMPAKFEAATGPGRLNAVIVTADPATGRATAIERLNLSAAEVDDAGGGDVRAVARLSRQPRRALRSRFDVRSVLAAFRGRSRDARAPGAARRHCLGVDRLDSRRCSSPASAISGSRARSPTAGCGTPATSISRSRMAARRSRR